MLAGQQSETGPIVLRLAGSARALGLGGVYPSFSPDADAIFYNPALLQSAVGLSLGTQLWGSSGQLYTFAGTNGAGFGVGVQFLDYELVAGVPVSIGSPFGLSEGGVRSAGELNATVAYARTFFGRLRVGLAGKMARHLGADESAGMVALDVGGAYNPFNWLNLSLALQNLGSTLEFNGTEYDPPARVALAAATRSRPLGALDVSLAARASIGPNDDFNAGLGAEIGYWPFSGLNFYLRGGFRAATGEYAAPNLVESIEEVPFNLGGGISWGRVALDYALEPYRNADSAHRIGVRVR
jgi:hypothetical protein